MCHDALHVWTRLNQQPACSISTRVADGKGEEEEEECRCNKRRVIAGWSVPLGFSLVFTDVVAYRYSLCDIGVNQSLVRIVRDP